MNRPKSGRLDWSLEGQSWPNHDKSRFHTAAGIDWHVQEMGAGPSLLLVHGTGASTHSWRSLAPLLASNYSVTAFDLPGHGFTSPGTRNQRTLPGMASAIADLLKSIDLQPTVVVGHSAGAALLIRCCLDGALAPESMISLNGALLPFRGAAGVLFPPLAKLLFLNPLMPHLLARRGGQRARVERLIRGTGSELDAAGIELYARLFENPSHVSATLGMMASWDLHQLERNLTALTVPLLLVAGDNDQAVPPSDAERVHRLLRDARLIRLPGLGHLAHEEDAETVVELINDFSLAEELGQ